MQGCSIFGLGLLWCGSEKWRGKEREEAEPEHHDSLLREHKLRCRTAEYAAWLMEPD